MNNIFEKRRLGLFSWIMWTIENLTPKSTIFIGIISNKNRSSGIFYYIRICTWLPESLKIMFWIIIIILHIMRKKRS